MAIGFAADHATRHFFLGQSWRPLWCRHATQLPNLCHPAPCISQRKVDFCPENTTLLPVDVSEKAATR
ncbi:MAG: hypothetical protein K8S55_10960, partial [Phycisphaerae bacterium]|nr:hypothetical protein [Phycisphaerae bacterium]